MKSNKLTYGQSLSLGQSMRSFDGRFTFTFQSDGNLVHKDAQGTVLWTSNTAGLQAKSAHMQGDGNFVLYTTIEPTVGAAVWATNTGGRPGGSVFLLVQDDGNVVLYDSNGVIPLWATNTGGR
ncbi:hypothetical protein ACN28S_24960 [Cystobacter fuscus]